MSVPPVLFLAVCVRASPWENTVQVSGAQKGKGVVGDRPSRLKPQGTYPCEEALGNAPRLGQTPLVNMCELLEGPRKSQARAKRGSAVGGRSLKTSTRTWACGMRTSPSGEGMSSMPASLSALHSYKKLTSVECTRIPTLKHFTAYSQGFKTKQKL